jgi:hypothetical protein
MLMQFGNKEQALKKQVRVAFGGSSSVEAPESYCLCESQCQALWYTREEIIRIRVKIRMSLRKKGTLDESHDTRRGLENMLNKGLADFREQNVKSILAVQAAKRKHAGVSDDDTATNLASLSMELNRESANRGVMLAARDMADACRIYKESPMTRSAGKLSSCCRQMTFDAVPTGSERGKATAARSA